MQAKHANGTIYDANAISVGHPLKAGPWGCDTQNCPVIYKSHRVATLEAGSDGAVARNGTFVHNGSDRAHSSTCYMNAVAAKQALLGQHANTLTVKGDTLLLKWGQSVKAAGPSGKSVLRRPPIARDGYAAILSAAKDIQRWVDASNNDAAVLNRYWLRHKGVNYTWSEFSYGPQADDLARLKPSIQGQVNNGANWPRLCRATVAAAPKTVTGGSTMVDLQADGLHNNAAVRVRLFANPGTEGEELLNALKVGMHVMVLGETWKVDDPTYPPKIDVSFSTQLQVLH